MHICMCCS